MEWKCEWNVVGCESQKPCYMCVVVQLRRAELQNSELKMALDGAKIETDDLRARVASVKSAIAMHQRVEKDLGDRLTAADRLKGELRKAAEIGAKNMRLWIQEGCGCGGDGHVCGIRRVQGEMETVEKILAEKRYCEAELFGASDQERCGKPLPCSHHENGKCEECGEPMHYGGKPGKDCGMVWPG